MSLGVDDRYLALWQTGNAPPDVFDFLAQCGDLNPAQQLAVLLADQPRRWQTDQALSVEEYTARLPDLAGNPDIKLQLAVGEYRARQSSGPSPSIDEFMSRFADISDALRRKLSELISRDEDEASTGFITTQTCFSDSAIRDQQFGRYRLMRVLGEGAFGRVYLGFDEELQRQVAVKVPTAERFRKPEDADAYLAEARTVASLDHSHIVPVHDVGRTGDGSIYVVSKFIEGRTLGDRIKSDRPDYDEAARLLAAVARALHHAHEKRLIHRDVKPANILIEEGTGTPYVADFGLAIREEEYLGISNVSGTPAYMSPEQARGEGHRLDRRSDIFSLGVVFYELLTGKRPFRGTTYAEVFHQILSSDPTRPREVDDDIPAELERICLRALSKRASNRYATAAELADDCLHWNDDPEREQKELAIVPKGLRSFDADDAEFFLELLPGPRNRDGLPESIQFWKTRIEESDPDKTFSVGLIYGPSGCGKTSLMKAGLLPRLSSDVVAICVEATPGETEARILRGLRKQLPDLPDDLGLVETFAVLRRGERKKVVVVLDQFEQWLHVNRNRENSDLVKALRQCDGSKVQCIIMVRDDFAMAVYRFMQDLETRILEGHNFATVDLFDVDHARTVLTNFGQAFGRLPAESGLSEAEAEFLFTAAVGLAQDGKVVSVRLALFAEMIKGKPWTPATLVAVGGTKGIGINFLEDTFCRREANPEHRIHQEAARKVLKALLPKVGTDIKGHMRPREELLKASGYRDHPRDFGVLLRILDGELRLITPTDREGSETETRPDPSSKYYQLTHDYLVPPVREWLTRKQKETRKGRATLRLEERSSMWHAHPDKRYLPNLWEFCSFCIFTNPHQRTHAQNQMMRAANRHFSRLVMMWICGSLLLLIGGTIVADRMRTSFKSRQAEELVFQLWHVEWEYLPPLVQKMRPLRQYWVEDVTTVFESENVLPEMRMRASLALADTSLPDLPFVSRQLLNLERAVLPVIAKELTPYGDDLAKFLWEEIDVEQLPHRQQLAYGAVVAQYDASNLRWSVLGPLVVQSLLQTDPIEIVQWTPLLDPARRHMVKPLIHNSVHSDSDRRYLAASILAHLASRDDGLLSEAEFAELILNSDGRQFSVVVSSDTRAEPAILRQTFRSVLSRPPPLTEGSQVEELLRRQANAVAAMYRFGYPAELWVRLDFSPDPRLRTRLIDSLADFGIPWSAVLEQAENSSLAGVRQAAVLSMMSYDAQLTDADKHRLIERLKCIFFEDDHFGVHAATGWLLGRLSPEFSQWAHRDAFEQELTDRPNWYVTDQNQRMVRIPVPGAFQIGSPESEVGRDYREYQYEVRIDYSFAISSHEISVQKFREFDPSFEYAAAVSSSPDCPVTNITFYDALRYCRWLSERENIVEDEMCYPPLNQIGPKMVLTEDYYRKTGYRLPREVEWEYAVRAGTVTSRFFGDSKKVLDRFARYALNSDERTWPVGGLQPNPLGLFDVYGNVAEWCHIEPQRRDTGYEICRGGSYRTTPRFLRSAMPFPDVPGHTVSVNGFRIVRTMK